MQTETIQLRQTKFTHVMRKQGKSGANTLSYLRNDMRNEIWLQKFGHLRKEIEVEGVKLTIFFTYHDLRRTERRIRLAWG